MFNTPTGAHPLSSKLFSRLGTGANGSKLLPVLLYPNYPKQKTVVRFEFKDSEFGRALEIHPVYILNEKGGLELIATRAWQVCEVGSPYNGFAWQCDDTTVPWSLETYGKEAALLEEAAKDSGWIELYNVDGVSHQGNPEFPDVVRLFNNEKPWEEGFGLLRHSDFLIPTGMKPVAFKLYYLMVLERVWKPKERKTKLKFIGVEDPAITPLITQKLYAPAMAA